MAIGTTGGCHCGAVQLRVAHPPEEVLECRCSICRRYGTLWSYYRKDELTVSGPTHAYAWGPKHIGFHFCKSCGCVVAWLPHGEDFGRRAVNARMLEGFHPDQIDRRVEENSD